MKIKDADNPLRRLVGKIFGFEAEILKHRSEMRALNQQIGALSWDDTFGMWTRNAFTIEHTKH